MVARRYYYCWNYIKSFKKNSITFKLDGSKDNLFEFPETNSEIEWVIEDKNDIKDLEKD